MYNVSSENRVASPCDRSLLVFLHRQEEVLFKLRVDFILVVLPKINFDGRLTELGIRVQCPCAILDISRGTLKTVFSLQVSTRISQCVVLVVTLRAAVHNYAHFALVVV